MHPSVPRAKFILLPVGDCGLRDVVVEFRDDPHELLLRQPLRLRGDGDAHALATVLQQLGLLPRLGRLGAGQGDHAPDALENEMSWVLMSF